MVKKKFRDVAGVPFDDDHSNGSTAMDDSLLQFDAAIFGEIAKADAAVERIRQINIFEITPDPAQPRRAVPHSVRRLWNGNPTTMVDLFHIWFHAINDERRASGNALFPLETVMLEQATPDDRLDMPGPSEATFIALVDLALSIRREGLTNPVTVVNMGRDQTGQARYKLETGERRWMAYHLLYAFFDGKSPHIPDERDQWGKIRAREMDALNVWRQATENSARANLNAIARTRQLAILILEILANEPDEGEKLLPFEAFAHEREYYAQVIDRRVPYGRNDALISAMGLGSRQGLDRYKKLLTLPNDIWHVADEIDCPEGFLRRIVQLPYPAQIERLTAWARSERNITLNLGASPITPAVIPRPTLPKETALQTGKRLIHEQEETWALQELRLLTRLREGVTQATPDTKKKIRFMIDDLRRLLDEVEGKLS